MENPLTDQQPGGELAPEKINPPADEQKSSTPPAETENVQSFFGKAMQSADKVLSAIKPGRGRPRKDGLPKKSDVVATPEELAAKKADEEVRAMAPEKNDGPTVETLDLQIIEVGLEMSIFAAFDSSKTALMLYGTKGGMTAVELKPYLDPLCITEKEKEAFVKLIQFFVKKYGLTMEHLPLIIAGVMVLSVALRPGLTFLSLRSAIAEKNKGKLPAGHLGKPNEK